ncbi:MAG: alpha/beta hydrolase [Chromatiales bacterium]|jgi:pimeloyl-ACP methyl ester carboxylesterase|nr:alpha/beta hydrolase [Chromatiales bacterium]
MNRTIVVTHGAWSAGWVWKKMKPLLAEHDIVLWSPTYTGLGERAHLANDKIDLDTHITDIVNVLEYEDLSDVVILAHSYGGMVGTGVVDRAASRVNAIIYLDAMVPEDGQSVLDVMGSDGEAEMRRRATEEGDGWKVTPNPSPPDTGPSDIEWVKPRRKPQPLGTFTQKIRLMNDTSHIGRSYIYCERSGPGDVFRQFADRAAANPDWRFRSMDASHNPHITCPTDLRDVLLELLDE